MSVPQHPPKMEKCGKAVLYFAMRDLPCVCHPDTRIMPQDCCRFYLCLFLYRFFTYTSLHRNGRLLETTCRTSTKLVFDAFALNSQIDRSIYTAEGNLLGLDKLIRSHTEIKPASFFHPSLQVLIYYSFYSLFTYARLQAICKRGFYQCLKHLVL